MEGLGRIEFRSKEASETEALLMFFDRFGVVITTTVVVTACTFKARNLVQVEGLVIPALRDAELLSQQPRDLKDLVHRRIELVLVLL